MKKKGLLFLVLFSLLIVSALPGISNSQSAIDGFDPNANSEVNSIAIQADGKILVGGDFTIIGGRRETTSPDSTRMEAWIQTLTPMQIALSIASPFKQTERS